MINNISLYLFLFKNSVLSQGEISEAKVDILFNNTQNFRYFVQKRGVSVRNPILGIFQCCVSDEIMAWNSCTINSRLRE